MVAQRGRAHHRPGRRAAECERVHHGRALRRRTGPDRGAGFIHTDDGAAIIGEPHVAATWFPVNDHPSDKACYVFRITVPAGLEVVANGVPRGRTTSGGLTTWTWLAAEPMASYLATATMGQFQLTDRTARKAPSPAAGDHRVPVQRVGPYPFAASGGIVDDTFAFGFALENQTRPIYARGFSFPDSGTSVVAHELAHQWYGDSVAATPGRTSGSTRAPRPTRSGCEARRAADRRPIRSSPASTAAARMIRSGICGSATPGVTGSSTGRVYDRGAMTLHALRGEIGDADFFALLETWAQSREDGNGTTPEFVALAEQISGQQLDGFFDAWLFTGSKPPLA